MIVSMVDISTLFGIESLFAGHRQIRDPWAKRLAGQLADLYVYSDELRYVFPVPSNIKTEDYPKPALVEHLKLSNEALMLPIRFHTDDLPLLQEEYLPSAFEAFLSNARKSKWSRNLKKWLGFQQMPWVFEGYQQRANRDTVFNKGLLQGQYDLNKLAIDHGFVDTQFLLYTFDVALRYSLYGALAGKNSYYAHHPIRVLAPTLPDRACTPAPMPPVCVSFQKSVEDLADKLTWEEYVLLLKDLRKQVRQVDLHLQAPGDTTVDQVREIAAAVKLTPHMRKAAETLRIASAAFGLGGTIISKEIDGPAIIGKVVDGLGVIPDQVGPLFKILGYYITIASVIWHGTLPRGFSRAKWLQWALEWPELEGQVVE